MNILKGYDFGCSCDTTDLQNIIAEGRLVPKDLSSLDTWSGNASESYFYVDKNGRSYKLSLEYILSNNIEIVKTLPENAEVGTIVFEEI